jgi:hypothetical protein
MIARLIMLAALAAVTGCAANGPPPLAGHRSKGHTIEGMQADAAACRNQARMIVGSNAYAYFWDAYTDCMLGKGYELDVGQKE